VIVAIKAIFSGKTYFPAEALGSVRASDFDGEDTQLLARISKRELRVLHGFAQGWSNKKIAEDMLLSNKTVSTYKARLMQKLNVSTLLELIDFAKRNSLG
jgi:two-component system response regulator EvgA